MGERKTLFLFSNSRLIEQLKTEKNIEVIVGSREVYEKFKVQIISALHPQVKYIWLKSQKRVLKPAVNLSVSKKTSSKISIYYDRS